MNAHPSSPFLRHAGSIFALAVAAGALVWLTSFEAALTTFSALFMIPQVPMAFPGVWWRRGSRPPSAKAHLDARVPVWLALSDLYLDTELDERDHARIAEVLARSGYSVHQLEEILYREVHPALISNLLSMCGEWGGFDREWLTNRILARDRERWGVALIVAKWLTRSDWCLIRIRVVELLRGEEPAARAPHESRAA